MAVTLHIEIPPTKQTAATAPEVECTETNDLQALILATQPPETATAESHLQLSIPERLREKIYYARQELLVLLQVTQRTIDSFTFERGTQIGGDANTVVTPENEQLFLSEAPRNPVSAHERVEAADTCKRFKHRDLKAFDEFIAEAVGRLKGVIDQGQILNECVADILRNSMIVRQRPWSAGTLYVDYGFSDGILLVLHSRLSV